MNIMRTLVYRHIPMYYIYVWCGISTCSPSVAPVLAAVSAELVPGDSTGWRMRCVNNKIHNMIPRHPSPAAVQIPYQAKRRAGILNSQDHSMH